MWATFVRILDTLMTDDLCPKIGPCEAIAMNSAHEHGQMNRHYKSYTLTEYL
jgi:hypothetical protein